MFLGKRKLIEARSVTNGSTSENFVNVFDDALALGFKNVLVEVEGLDESGANIAMRYYNTAGSLVSDTNYSFNYVRVNSTSNASYSQHSGSSYVNYNYDFLWKSGNFGQVIFFDPTAAARTYAISQNMLYNATTFSMHHASTAMGGFRFYNAAGGSMSVESGEYAKIKVYGIEDS
jgi:hypothetical protein